MDFSIRNGNFYSGNKAIFLNSGEIHYFRIGRNQWRLHLEAAVEAQLTTVSSYVPWIWHEPEEGLFDFDGYTHTGRDLKGWLELCKQYGLACILKPGPFILAEMRGAGLPNWFLEKYGDQVKMRNRTGVTVQSDGVSLFNPLFIGKVEKWYDQVMPVIASYQQSNGGPVIMMQLCNEIGVFSWLAHQADYSEAIRLRFIEYLRVRSKTIAQLNQLWETNYNDFDDIELPPDGYLPYTSPGDRSRDYEWHCFWRTCYGDYLRMLTQWVRKRGVTIPLYHNLPGWMYGSGYDFPLNISMYDDLYGAKSELLFGVDHIPEFVSFRNMHDDRIINDITAAVQPEMPLFAAEFQSGSREYHVVTTPAEMELFYKASIANGLKGWNYYMFSQGRNTRQRGYSGDTFYWFTPLSAEGQRSTAFPLVRRINRLIKTSEPLIINSRPKTELCVLFYPPYYATELERPENGASELNFVPSAIRKPAWFDGLLRAFQAMNVEFEIKDLTRTNPAELGVYKQVWAFATDEMNETDQQTLLQFVQNGGNLVIFPAIPTREMSQKPCTLLSEAFNARYFRTETTDSPLIDLLGINDVKCANPQLVYGVQNLENAAVIARTISGNPCGFIKQCSNGTVIHIGTWLGFDTESHKPAYEALLRLSDTTFSSACCDNGFIRVRQRFTEQKEGILFVGNYFNEDHSGSVQYTHPDDGSQISIPLSSPCTNWPAIYGLLTPVCLSVLPDLWLLHSTSDVLEIRVAENQLHLTLHGHRDMYGEIVFEGSKTTHIEKASVNGSQITRIECNQRVAFVYQHFHKQEFTIVIDFIKPVNK